MIIPILTKNFGRGAWLVALFGAATFQAHAGDIVGRAFDVNTGSYLPGVVIEVVGRNVSTVSDVDGRYRLLNVPAGAQQVRVSYLGYDPVTSTVTVPATGDVAADLNLGGEVHRLAAFTVEGYKEGRSRALQQKQSATNISDIISADAIGNLPDRNIAEAVARVAGVNMSLDQGEGRYVSIRGVEPNLNQVLLDGATMAAPGGTRLGRAVPLDALGTGQITQIEVIKSATPDMDANALGGTLNLKTASPFDRKGRFVSGSLAGNRNETTAKTDLEARLSFSDTFGPGNKWGLAAGASYEKRHFSNNWLQSGWNLRAINGANVYLPNELEIKPEWGSNIRRGGNLSLEFRPDADTQFFLRPTFSRNSRQERTVEVIHAVDNTAARTTLTSPTTGTFAGAGVRTERRDFDSLKVQDLFSVAGGIKKVIGDFTVEPMATYSSAKEDTPYNRILAFRNANGGTGPVNFDFGDFDFRRWDVDATVDVPSKYSLRRTRDDFGVVEEDTLTAKIDVRWDARALLGRPGFFKTGFKYLSRDRTVDLESRRLIPVGNWNLGAIGVDPAISVYDGRYTSGFLINAPNTWAYIKNNPALTVLDPIESITNSIEDDYKIKEFIYAGYAMGQAKFGAFTLLGGLRWEKTDATVRAVEARSAGTTLLGRFPTSGTTRYDKLFPNLQGVYRFTDRLLLRAAITETIGRPAYEDARPLAIFRYDPLGNAALNAAFPFSGTVNVGNPKLGPYEARNYDLSFEWYLKGSGIVSLAAFRKEVANPIYTYSEVQRNVVYSGVSLESLSLTSKLNATSGRISGLELNFYQPFKFLPSPFDGFGLDANFTRITSEEVVPTRPGEDLPFFRQPGKIANVTLFYEKNNFSARLAWSYSDRQIYSLGSNVLADVYRNPRGQYDLQLRYRINSRYAITGSVRNLTREKEQFAYGVTGLMRTSRLLDRDYKLGVSFNY
ncbi:MAG: TonB-dependent receptor [Opitutus sp.]|nr:TonB-dependent receptor [Opitutus sp.]